MVRYGIRTKGKNRFPSSFRNDDYGIELTLGQVAQCTDDDDAVEFIKNSPMLWHEEVKESANPAAAAANQAAAEEAQGEEASEQEQTESSSPGEQGEETTDESLDTENPVELPDFDDMTVTELRQYASDNNVNLQGATRKDDIVAVLEEAEARGTAGSSSEE